MPITLRVVDDQFVVFHVEGEVIEADFERANVLVYESMDPAFARYQIVDMTGVTKLNLSTAAIERLAMQDERGSKSLGKIAIACVATKDLPLGFSRIWELFVQTAMIETAVFRDLETARAWIMRKRS